ncbi:hypothetical protein V1264_013745 [Littorina saxatilis]|uniref:Uncharacterized protein n=2 Tax=Littorina saxatilis TaxID=31220 RepID=A0AAN9GIJ2_9CAEN
MCSLSSTLRFCCVGPAPFDDIGDIPYHCHGDPLKDPAGTRRRSNSETPEIPKLPVWISRTPNDTCTYSGQRCCNRRLSRKFNTPRCPLSGSAAAVGQNIGAGESAAASIGQLSGQHNNLNDNAAGDHEDIAGNENKEQLIDDTDSVDKNNAKHLQKHSRVGSDGDRNLNNCQYLNDSSSNNQRVDKTRDNRHLNLVRNDTRDLQPTSILTREDFFAANTGGARNTKNLDNNLHNDSDRHGNRCQHRRCCKHGPDTSTGLMSKMTDCVQSRRPKKPVEFYSLDVLTTPPPLGPPMKAWESTDDLESSM